MKKKIFIIDTSALLSGKSINLGDQKLITVSGVSNELKEGGRDYQNFQFLLEKGLIIMDPTPASLQKIKKTAQETGDINKLSTTDIQLLALAYEITTNTNTNTIILTDDYSIQNVATTLHLSFEQISQKVIQKKYQWYTQCKGCKKIFTTSKKICPICGSETKLSHKHTK
ncbi:MAG: nucleic acid-binding protein [Thermoplasmatota archaeon]